MVAHGSYRECNSRRIGRAGLETPPVSGLWYRSRRNSTSRSGPPRGPCAPVFSADVLEVGPASSCNVCSELRTASDCLWASRKMRRFPPHHVQLERGGGARTGSVRSLPLAVYSRRGEIRLHRDLTHLSGSNAPTHESVCARHRRTEPTWRRG